MMFPNPKSRDLIVGIGDDSSADGEHSHIEAMHVIGSVRFIRHSLLMREFPHALKDQVTCLGMQFESDAQSGCGTLAASKKLTSTPALAAA